MIGAEYAIHIGAGLAGIATAGVALASRKGGRLHRRAGTLYLWIVGVIVVSAIALMVDAIGFSAEFFISMFLTAFLAFSGVRALARKRLDAPGAVRWFDIAAAAGMLGVAVGTLAIAAAVGYHKRDLDEAWALASFAALFASFDLVQFAARRRFARVRRLWLSDHLTKLTFDATLYVTFFTSSRRGSILFHTVPDALRVLGPLAACVAFVLWSVRAAMTRR